MGNEKIAPFLYLRKNFFYYIYVKLRYLRVNLPNSLLSSLWLH